MRRKIMATKLNKRAFEHTKNLISNGKYVQDEKDKWSEHQPSADKENKFIEKNGISEYGKWYLGIEGENNKGHYKFPLAILKMFIAMVYLPLKLELGSTNILILKMQ
ncbi:MAG: hypothetical protein ACJ72R_05800 [Nitrososphaeraceae archaeon]